MPLVRNFMDPGDPWNMNLVRFSMLDGAEQVRCAVTARALEDLLGSDVPRSGTQMLAAFDVCRDEVEKIARALYDEGKATNGEVLVTNSS